MRFALLLVLTAAAALAAWSARAEGLDQLPQTVAEEIRRADAACRRTRGEPKYQLSEIVRTQDISADSVPDYFVDYSKFICAGTGGQILCSIRGCSLQIFLSAGGNSWIKAFDDRVLSFSLGSTRDGRAFAEIESSGDDCGRPRTQTCKRRLIGDKTEIKFLD